MTSDQIVHGFLRSYGRFIEPSVHAEFAADLRAALAECERAALERAAQISDDWGGGDEDKAITPIAFDRRHGVYVHLSAAIRALIR